MSTHPMSTHPVSPHSVSESAGFFFEHLPWNFITKYHEGVVLQKDGILQRTFAYRAPDVDSSSASEVNSLAVKINDFSRRLGQGWAFQLEAQRFYTTDYPRASFEYPTGNFGSLAPYLVDRERESAFRAAGSHFESSYYLTFIYKPPSENVKKLTGMFIQSGEGNGGSGIMENVNFFVNETNAVAAVLSYDMLLAPLSNEETVSYLHSSVSLNRHPIHFPATSILLDRILPDEELDTSLTMKLGDYWIPILGVNDFPEETYPAILDELNRLRLEYRWVSRYICLDKEEGAKEARKKEKAHRGNRKTFFQTFAESTGGQSSGRINYGAGVKEQDSINAGVEIETDVASLGYYTTNVMVWSKDLKTARRYADMVKATVNSAGFTCKQETFNALEAFKSMMPGQVYANYRSLPVMSYTLSHIVPLSSVWAGIRRNIHAQNVTGVDLPHLICSTQEGTPFFLNLNPSDVGHAAIWGPTGSGKSTLLNLLEIQFFKYPLSLVIVFDKGRSARQSCLASGGLFYEPSSQRTGGMSFQPLRELETERDVMDAGDFIESLITVSGNEVTPPMRVVIKETLELLKEKPLSARTLTSFVQYAAYQDPETKRPVFKELLSDYLWDGGKYGKIFDDRNSGISLDSRFLVFEMEDLMNRGPLVIVPALVYLFNLVEKMFDGRLTLLVLDEAWLFLKNKTFSDKIAEWLKVLRKKNVFVVFATQDVADVENSPLKTTIIQQCLTKIYLADPSALTAGMRRVYEAFGLTEAEISLIASATMKRDYFYTSPLGRRLFQLDLGPVTLALIGSADHEGLDRLIEGKEPGSSFCGTILDSKRVDYSHLLDYDAPFEEEPKNASRPAAGGVAAGHSAGSGAAGEAAVRPRESKTEAKQASVTEKIEVKAASILEAVKDIMERKNRAGSGRAAEAIASRFAVSPATVYQAKKLLKAASPDVLEAVKDGKLSIKAAYKSLEKESEQAR